MSSQKTITRFAPAPTGFLHIGGARTALFNWAFAHHHGGKFLLRIEDTDRSRSTPEAIDAILDGLDWLGLKWDDDIIYQHQRAARHIEIVHELLAAGKAYKCFCTPEELEAMREKARADGQPAKYDGRWRERDTSEAPPDAPYVIRFKAPQSGDTIVEDAIRGRVVIANDQLDDLILLRTDGTPTYMLSVVVDDYDMGITHVIRGDDHLTNAARQSGIYNALGWTVPLFAHIPLIHGADGAKLSKRHGALGVDYYRAQGYLPEAMRNYLARLGWSHGDDELFTTEELVKWFTLDTIGKSPARFDSEKLDYINAHHITHADDASLVAEIIARKPEYKNHSDKLHKAMPYLKAKSKGLDALADTCGFVIAAPAQVEEKLQKALNDQTRPLLTELAARLEGLAVWTSESIESCVSQFMADQDLKMNQIGPALRACLTGTTQSPAIYDVLVLLGQAEAVQRIRAKTG